MVAPCGLGQISRSMVRVPGSGMQDGAAPVCLNLGIVSQVAAIVPVPQTLVTIGSDRRTRHRVTSSCSFDGSTNHKLTGETVTSRGTSLSVGDVIKADLGLNSQRPQLHLNSRAFPNQRDAQTARRAYSQGILPTEIPRETPVVDRRPHKRPFNRESSEEGNVSFKRWRGVSSESQQSSMNNVNASGSTLTNFNEAANMPLPSITTGTTGNIPPSLNTSMLSSSTSSSAPSSSSPSSSTAPLIMEVVTSSGQKLAMPISQNQANRGVVQALLLKAGTTVLKPVLVSSNNSLPGTTSEDFSDMERLILERDHLQKQNQVLKYRLAKFQQLMKNKPQLINVVRRLNAVAS